MFNASDFNTSLLMVLLVIQMVHYLYKFFKLIQWRETFLKDIKGSIGSLIYQQGTTTFDLDSS